MKGLQILCHCIFLDDENFFVVIECYNKSNYLNKYKGTSYLIIQRYNNSVPNIAVKWLALLLCIQEVIP